MDMKVNEHYIQNFKFFVSLTKILLVSALVAKCNG